MQAPLLIDDGRHREVEDKLKPVPNSEEVASLLARGRDAGRVMDDLAAVRAHNEEVERRREEAADSQWEEMQRRAGGAPAADAQAIAAAGSGGVTFDVPHGAAGAAEEAAGTRGRGASRPTTADSKAATDSPTAKKHGLFGGLFSFGAKEEVKEEAAPAEEPPEFIVHPGAKPLYRRRQRSAHRPIATVDGKARRERTLDEQRQQNHFAQLMLVDRRRKVQEEVTLATAVLRDPGEKVRARETAAMRVCAYIIWRRGNTPYVSDRHPLPSTPPRLHV